MRFVLSEKKKDESSEMTGKKVRRISLRLQAI
jgi:hypothetical protein